MREERITIMSDVATRFHISSSPSKTCRGGNREGDNSPFIQRRGNDGLSSMGGVGDKALQSVTLLSVLFSSCYVFRVSDS